jgi:hypothetical protein
MESIEKTVFISYRRKDISWALLVYKDLDAHGFDVFFDYISIASGDFERIIISNIKARAHFLVVLTPSALDRCDQPGDWLRREIETAIKEKRNIVPLFCAGFTYSDTSISKHLTGDLKMIKKYNGLDVPPGYFDSAMERLRTQFLNIEIDAVLHPVSDEVQKVVGKCKIAVNKELAHMITRGEPISPDNENFSRNEKLGFGQIDIKNLKAKPAAVCNFCHEAFQVFEQRVTCDFCGAQYHRIGASHGSCPPMNMQGVHICVKCHQPIDSKKYRAL